MLKLELTPGDEFRKVLDTLVEFVPGLSLVEASQEIHGTFRRYQATLVHGPSDTEVCVVRLYDLGTGEPKQDLSIRFNVEKPGPRDEKRFPLSPTGTREQWARLVCRLRNRLSVINLPDRGFREGKGKYTVGGGRWVSVHSPVAEHFSAEPSGPDEERSGD